MTTTPSGSKASHLSPTSPTRRPCATPTGRRSTGPWLHCRLPIEGLRQLRAVLRERADYHAAPVAVRARLQGLAAPAGRPAAPSAAATGLQRWFAWRPMAVSLGVVAVFATVLALTWLPLQHDDRVTQEAIAGQVRAALGQRVVDVASSDQHTVKPWLS